MQTETYKLPKNNADLCDAINSHLDRSEMQYAARFALYDIYRLALAGCRRFTTLDIERGTVVGSYVDKDGRLEFNSPQLLKAINDNAGRFVELNWNPSATREDYSLEAIRERAIAQIEADAIIRPSMLNSIKTAAASMFCTLGGIGFAGHLLSHPSMGLTSDIEIIHPRELFPFPCVTRDQTKAIGICRQRTVSLDYLKSRYGKRIGDKIDRLDGMSISFGEEMNVPNGTLPTTYWNASPSSISTGNSSTMYIVKVREVYLYGPNGTVREYAAISGDVVLERAEYYDVDIYCPIGYARFFENGTFHGSGICDLIYSFSRESEKMFKALFANVHSADRYGILVLPQGTMNERVMKETGLGMKTFFFDPDPASLNTDFKATIIKPSDSGDMAGRVAAFAQQVIDAANPVQNLIKEKGRVESARGLQFLDEQMGRSASVASASFSTALGTVFRSLVARANQELTISRRPIPVSRLTLDLAGAVIDPQANTVSFSENPIPDISRINFSIRDVAPKSPVARKEEAIAYLVDTPGLTDPQAVKIFMLQEGLDPAMWIAEEQAAYETCVRNCVLLYGDGETPGQIVFTPEEAMPELQARIVKAFMGSIKMQFASPEVRDAFREYLTNLQDFMAPTLPPGYSPPEDEALTSQPGMDMLNESQAPQLQA